MKKVSTYLLIICLPLFLLCNCSSGIANRVDSAHGFDPNQVQPTKSDTSPQSWDYLLRKLSGIEVKGSYPNLSLKIRGSESFLLSTEPLFVLEGVALGTNFNNLDGAVTPADVRSIRVLKGSDASMYGVRGANGVIEVTLKNKRAE